MCIWRMCLWAVWVVACATQVQARDVRVAVDAVPVVPGAPFDTPSDVRSVLFDALTRFDANGELAPALAMRWQSETPVQWRFVLRRGVIFSNGEPFTADAVVATLAWLQTDPGRLTIAGSRLPALTAEADDEGGVIIRTAKPDPLLPRKLADVMIVAPGAWSDVGPDAYAAAPITTGPFKLVSRHGGTITLAANPDSWRKPKADKLILTVMPDRAARVRAVLDGRADIATRLDVADIAALEKGNVLTSVTPAMAVLAVAFRQDAGRETPLRDPNVRRALNYAVDKDALNRSALRGLGHPAGQPAARDVQGYDPGVKAYPYDPGQAKALLAEAGHGAGLSLRIAVTGQYAGDVALYEGLREMLAKVGVTLDVAVVDHETWSRGVQLGTWTADGGADVDGFSFPFAAAPTNDVTAAVEPYSCFKLVPFVCDQTLTPKITAVTQAMGVERRMAMLSDLGQTFHDQAPALYLSDAFDVTGVRRGVDGFTVANRIPIYENVSVGPDR
jgi:peptide/nickel transport system substrate-binding protein